MRRYHTAASGKSAGKLVLCGARVFCRNGGADAHHDADLVKEVSKNTYTPVSDLTRDDIELYQKYYQVDVPENNVSEDDEDNFVIRTKTEYLDFKPVVQEVKVWLNKDGKIHRDGDKPARVSPSGTQEWYKDGKIHRDGDKPAVISHDGTQSWYKDGKIHRDGDQPARISHLGVQTWYKDGKVYREGDKPTMMLPNGVQIWNRIGRTAPLRHRDDGKPAVVFPSGKKEYWVDGVRVYPEGR